MQDTQARLALRRAYGKNSASRVEDFATPESSRGVLRPTLVALVMSGLAVLGAGGVAMAAAATSTDQAKYTLVTDKNAPDTSHAAPEDLSLDAHQKAAQADTKQTDEGGSGAGLSGFNQRGTTPNRNGVRSALNGQLANTKGAERAKVLNHNSQAVLEAQSKAEAEERERLLQADIAKVKKEAARIKEEKRKAAELMKKLKAKGEAGKAATDANGKPVELSAADLKAIGSGSGACTPLAAGTYSVGAYFGQVGSWSRYHTGQDFPAPTGTPIYAASSGVVGSSSGGSWAGTHVIIHHAGGGSTLYAHMSAMVVSPGTPVKACQLIGYVGDTGRSFGSHLHFEYYPAGTTPGDVYSAADPMAWLRTRGA